MPEVDAVLKRKIRGAGLSFREVADNLGVKYSRLSQWMNGFVSFPPKERLKIIKMIELAEEELKSTNGG